MGFAYNTYETEEEATDDHLPRIDETARRILNLLFVLNTAPGPLTTEQIVSDSDLGYGSGNRASDQRKFKRDRERLATYGIVIHEVKDEVSLESEESAWEIDRSRTHADPRAITADDAQVVLAAIDETFELHADNPERWPLQRAYLKLQEIAGHSGQVARREAAEEHGAGRGEAFSRTQQMIWDSFVARHPARFTYCDARGNKKDRELEVYGLFSQGNHSYLVGFDRTAQGMRTFRTDRIVRARKSPASADTYRVPAEFDVEDYQFLPFDFSDRAPVEAVFQLPGTVDEHELALLTHGRGALARLEVRDAAGNSANAPWTWTVAVRDLDAAAAFALEHASLGMRPTAPAELIDCWRECIRKAVSAHGGEID